MGWSIPSTRIVTCAMVKKRLCDRSWPTWLKYDIMHHHKSIIIIILIVYICRHYFCVGEFLVNCFCPVTVYINLICFNFSHRVILAKCTIPATRLTSLMSSSWRKCLTRLVQHLRDPNLTTLIPGSGCKAPGITKAALATLLIYFPSSSAPFLSVPLMEFSSPTSAGTSW